MSSTPYSREKCIFCAYFDTIPVHEIEAQFTLPHPFGHRRVNVGRVLSMQPPQLGNEAEKERRRRSCE